MIQGPLVGFFLRDEILPSFIEILLSHYKDPGEILMNQSVFKNFMSWELLRVTGKLTLEFGMTTEPPNPQHFQGYWEAGDSRIFSRHILMVPISRPQMLRQVRRRGERSFVTNKNPNNKQQVTVFWIPWIPILASCWSCWTCTPGRPHWPLLLLLQWNPDGTWPSNGRFFMVHVCARFMYQDSNNKPSCWKFSASNRRQTQMCWVEKI